MTGPRHLRRLVDGANPHILNGASFSDARSSGSRWGLNSNGRFDQIFSAGRAAGPAASLEHGARSGSVSGIVTSASATDIQLGFPASERTRTC